MGILLTKQSRMKQQKAFAFSFLIVYFQTWKYADFSLASIFISAAGDFIILERESSGNIPIQDKSQYI